ncbi:Gfo/Idh/MocA family protein [Aquirufa nivalisilvae]|uniref:Gfo/Idh/MocA family protein n=1 Tax=Aquirufa nivalisilvae TaxID=2516557 RepID=UPI0022A9A27F|nr:Gfo/Idh/MocA family oxidoreductase [Aquirufa nivalisilvae]MCZ2479651.1 Gfo/Idh/MocA family oxidoreductase [Aquirufa nivalisilvae]
MKENASNRRKFLQDASLLSSLAFMPSIHSPIKDGTSLFVPKVQEKIIAPRLKFGVIGINHGHIYTMANSIIRGGGEFVSYYAKEPDLIKEFAKKYPTAKLVKSEAEILGDPSIQLILSSITPVERAPLGIRVMKSGKDYMVDKPGITTLEQLAEVRKVQKETKRIYSISYSERFENKATEKASQLAQTGIIGKVVQTLGTGPHRMSIPSRPSWFFDKKYYGGIITDIGSHQVDQFLHFTKSIQGEVVASQVANHKYPQYPNFEDFGDLMLRGNGGSGYIRVDWFTPDGLNTWGDGRLTILGTEGYMEVRKNTDIASPHGTGSHLYLVTNKETLYIDCKNVELPHGELLVNDVLNRTETAMTQDHCFLATELALIAQKQATKISAKS